MAVLGVLERHLEYCLFWKDVHLREMSVFQEVSLLDILEGDLQLEIDVCPREMSTS